MGCVQSTKLNEKRRRNNLQSKISSKDNQIDCSIQVIKERFNPDLMKNKGQAADLNDYSLCAIDKKNRGGNYDDIVECDEFNNHSFDEEKNTNSSKSYQLSTERQQQQQQQCQGEQQNNDDAISTKHVVPAQMQMNWQLQNNITESSLLQRRIISNKLKIHSNPQILSC